MGICNSKAADPNFHNIQTDSIAAPLPSSLQQKPSNSPSLRPHTPGLASPAVAPVNSSLTVKTMPNPSSSFDQKEQPSPSTRTASSASLVVSPAAAAPAPMPSEAELNVAFESFMEEKCMKPEARAGMRKLPNTTKWMMLQAETQMKSVAAQKAANSQNGGGVNEESVLYWVQLLKDGKYSKNQAESLKISLRGAGKTWMKEFAEEGGVSLMLEAVGRGGRGVGGVMSELLSGIKTFMNNEYGLSVVVNTPQGIDCLIAALTSTDDGQRMQLVDLLAVICWISDTGHELIVNSFQQRVKSYSVLVASLSSTNVELLTRVLTFINALINAVPLLEDRVSMRQQMVDLGLTTRLAHIQDVIDSHRGDRWDSVEKLSVQLELYGQVRDADSRETLIAGVDFSDVDAAFEYVKRSAVEDGHSSALIDLLHVLAVVDHSGDKGNKGSVWDNIVYAVSVISQRLDQRSDDDPLTSSPLLTYDQLRTLLAEKEKEDVVARKDHMADLEVAVEQQRKAANEATYATGARARRVAREGRRVPSDYTRGESQGGGGRPGQSEAAAGGGGRAEAAAGGGAGGRRWQGQDARRPLRLLEHRTRHPWLHRWAMCLRHRRSVARMHHRWHHLWPRPWHPMHRTQITKTHSLVSTVNWWPAV